MQDAELFAFMEIFRELLSVFPKRMDEGELGQLSKAYFTTLRRHSVADLRAAAEAWMQRGKFFPKPAEWIAAIPQRNVETAALLPLSAVEAAEYLDAEHRRWDGDPCGCLLCRAAGVTHRLLRYVPEDDEREKPLRGLIGERVVTRGRWLHGDELRRWYAARDAFQEQLQRVIGRKAMPELVL